MSKTTLIAAAAIVLVAVVGAAFVLVNSEDRGHDPVAPDVEAFVWIDDGTQAKYEGTGKDIVSIIESVSERDIVFGNNGNIVSVDGVRNADGKTWAIFRWASPGGWTEVASNTKCVDGMNLAVKYSERIVEKDGYVHYSAPEIDVKYEVHFFLRFEEKWDATDWMEELPLTEAEKRNGLWIHGTGTNPNDALADAVISTFYDGRTVEKSTGESDGNNYISYSVDGKSGIFDYGTRPDMYGWFLYFLGWTDTPSGDGLWTYWCQFTYSPEADTLDNPAHWGYNQKSFGMYDITEYRYFALVLKTTSEEGGTASLPAPSEMPARG